MKDLTEIHHFLLDMDGTFYLGDTLLPGAADFLDICRGQGIGFTFLTNNSSKSRQAYIDKLAQMGVAVSETEIYTSGDATLAYLNNSGVGRDILLIGTDSLARQFEQAGFSTASPTPKAVVVGFDTTLTYAKLCALCDAVRGGVPYIATHPDLNCPVYGGSIPDIGAVIAFVEASTGRRPDLVVGKPNALIAEAVSAELGLPLHSMCMVGDRLYTDIALGRCGISTVLVMSGETKPEDLAGSDITPDWIYSNLGELGRAMLCKTRRVVD